MKMLKTGGVASLTIAAALTSLTPSRASADTVYPTFPGDRVTHDVAIDLPITVVVGSLWLGSQLLQPILSRRDCLWCDRDSDGNDTLNGLDKGARDAFRWSNTEAANTASNVIGYGVSPVAALGLTALASGLDGRLDETPTNVLLTLEASMTAAVLTQFVKFAVGRERPFVHNLAEEEKKNTAKPSDNNVSFFSAHSNFAFALAVSSGTIASLRGYRYAPLVWATGLTLATSIGYLRIAADRHYLSDVLTGAIVGSAVGFGVPFLFHRGEPSKGSKGEDEAIDWAPSGITASSTSFSMAWQW